MTARNLLCLPLLLALLWAAPAQAALDFEWHISRQAAVSPLSVLNSFDTELINTGDQTDTYTITLQKNHPVDWVSSLCEGTTCYLPWITEIEVTLAPGDTASILVDMTALDFGTGTADVTITNGDSPAVAQSEVFTVLTVGPQTLVVASDDMGGHHAWYTAALTGAGKSNGVWHRQAMGSPTLDDLFNFSAVFWLAGNHSGALDDADRATLAAYVAGGGNLLVSGRDLAWENCDPGSPYYSAGTKAWYNAVLGADYAGTLGPSYAQVTGYTTLFFDIFGGNGANNAQNDFDTLGNVAGGVPCLFYALPDGNPAAIAGVFNNYVSGKTYTLGFGFEAAATQTDRDLLMGRILAWFFGEPVPASDDVPSLLTGPAVAVPNPFNPRTSLRFEIGGSGSVPVDVSVFDLRGRQVRRLFNGDLAPGPQNLNWDGRDDRQQDLPAGVYLARIRTSGPTRTVKMTLAK